MRELSIDPMRLMSRRDVNDDDDDIDDDSTSTIVVDDVKCQFFFTLGLWVGLGGLAAEKKKLSVFRQNARICFVWMVGKGLYTNILVKKILGRSY